MATSRSASELADKLGKQVESVLSCLLPLRSVLLEFQSGFFRPGVCIGKLVTLSEMPAYLSSFLVSKFQGTSPPACHEQGQVRGRKYEGRVSFYTCLHLAQACGFPK